MPPSKKDPFEVNTENAAVIFLAAVAMRREQTNKNVLFLKTFSHRPIILSIQKKQLFPY